MGAQLDRLRYEVFQNLFYSPMDTGFLRSAVATVLTAYGIETMPVPPKEPRLYDVATVLTAYGIETIIYLHRFYKIHRCNSAYRLRY